MSSSARTAVSTCAKVLGIERPFSNFDCVERAFAGLPPLRRILSQVRQHGGKTMVVEELSASDDLKQEDEDIRKRHPEFAGSRARRLSFFTKGFTTSRGLSSATPDEFLGYAIVKTDILPARNPVTRVYESVVRASKHPNNCIRGAQTWQCAVLGCPFPVVGYLYAQQNDTTNVCAHVAMRTAAARFHGNGDMLYREMNDLIGVDHTTRTVGGGSVGLRSDEMVAILEAAGATCFVGDYSFSGAAEPNVPFQKFLYGSIESGFPALVVFETAREGEAHAIPVFGHTFNEDAWVPNADFSYFRLGHATRYIPSESWLSMYLAHDDNWGSNFCIPRRYLHTRPVCTHVGDEPEPCPEAGECVAFVIGTMPKRVKLDPIQAEAVGVDYLLKLLPQIPGTQAGWALRLHRHADAERLVVRTILVSRQDYVRHLRSLSDWEGRRIPRPLVDALSNLPVDVMWMVELSVPELFSANKRKVGEVLLRAERPAGHGRDLRSFVLARLPEHFAFYKEGGPTNPNYAFIPSGIRGHVSLYGLGLVGS